MKSNAFKEERARSAKAKRKKGKVRSAHVQGESRVKREGSRVQVCKCTRNCKDGSAKTRREAKKHMTRERAGKTRERI